MKIYILRHEDRTMDGTFFSPLTQDGLDNAVKLIELLNKYNIDCIYSSPFIRTLQTVYPYAKSKGLKINADHSLSEIQHPHIIPVKSFQIT
jgi:2,3-bisphosphoglycerate-dependent phosphoglycerate mutase